MSIKGRNNNNINTYYFLILTILVGFITTSFVYCDGDNTSLSLQESNDRNEKFAKFQLDLVKNIASTKDVNKLKIMLEQALNEISTTTTAETIVGEGKSLNMLKDKNKSICCRRINSELDGFPNIEISGEVEE